MRLSHRLVALHSAGVAVLFLVVLVSLFFVSTQYNRLARDASADLVHSSISAFRERLAVLVRDYSIWDEAHQAILRDDRAWLYSNIGVAAAEIGTLDMILIVKAPASAPYGWRMGSPPDGDTGLLSVAMLSEMLAVLDSAHRISAMKRTVFAELDGEPWIFAAAPVRPVSAPRPDSLFGGFPVQVQGIRLTQEQVTRIGSDILIPDLRIAAANAGSDAALPLVDYRGWNIASLVWKPPRPDASILMRIAVPLGSALLLIAIISWLTSRNAIRSAQSLERALFDAKAGVRSRTEFLSNVSHELRTPMNGIMGAAQLLRTTDLSDEQAALVDILSTSANAQMALISDLLDLSRLEYRGRHATVETFEPDMLLKDIANMIRMGADRRRIGFETDWTELEGIVLRGDAKAFRQIVTNLLANAIKFTEAGKVCLDAEIATTGGRASIVIRVTDTGPGIAGEELSRIFERFYQVDSSVTRSKEGTGLGLAISQELARTMGGRITVASRVGVGSTFEFSADFEIVARQGVPMSAAWNAA